MVIFILLAFIVVCITIDAIVQYRNNRKIKTLVSPNNYLSVFNENSLSIPRGIYFDTTHTWAFMEKSGYVKVGIDEFILHITGSLSNIKMKSLGDKVKKGEPIFTLIQDGKHLSIKSPISGTIVSFNNLLNIVPEILNKAPYNDGWIYTIEPSNWASESKFLIMSDKYREWVKNEFIRLKDFLITTLLSKNSKFTPILIQDGGELIDNILKDLDPKVWEDFQSDFIDK